MGERRGKGTITLKREIGQFLLILSRWEGVLSYHWQCCLKIFIKEEHQHPQRYADVLLLPYDPTATGHLYMNLASRLPKLYRGCSWTYLWALQVYTRTVVNAYMWLNTMTIYTLKYIYCIQKSYTFHNKSKFNQFIENHSCNVWHRYIDIPTYETVENRWLLQC